MIDKQAVLHIPLSQYAYAPSESQLTIRLRAARGNLDACTLHYADRAYPKDPLAFTAAKMQIAACDEWFDYYECTITPGLTRVCYYFYLRSGKEQAYYCADLFVDTLPEVRSEFYQYPFIRREEVLRIPNWFRQAVVYNIFPDSFASGRRALVGEEKWVKSPGGTPLRSKLGGTLAGITQNLDYIQSLGFNCIYLNPIFTAEDYHKYDLIDYFHIDPCFGTDADFSQLVGTAHKLGLRVVIDGVFNHCGKHFFAFQDVLKNGATSRYAGWFYELEFPLALPKNGEKPTYSCFAYEPKMPKLNTSNPEVRDYFLEVCRHWTRNFKVDGWRLDVANEVDREFWRAFRRTAKEENPECVLIAEIWESAESWLRGDLFDSTMNYDFRKHCRDFFALGRVDAAGFDARCTMMRMRYPTPMVDGQLNLLDSHDVSRFLSLCEGDARKLKLAVLFLAAFPGVPSVFYGDELGVCGITEDEYRKAMPWNTQTELPEFYKQAMSLRKFPALWEGAYHTLAAEKNSMFYAFERRQAENVITVALNAGGSPARPPIPLPPTLPNFSQGYRNWTFDAFGFAVWVEQKGE